MTLLTQFAAGKEKWNIISYSSKVYFSISARLLPECKLSFWVEQIRKIVWKHLSLKAGERKIKSTFLILETFILKHSFAAVLIELVLIFHVGDGDYTKKPVLIFHIENGDFQMRFCKYANLADLFFWFLFRWTWW